MPIEEGPWAPQLSQAYKDIEHSIGQSKLRDSESLESTLKNSTLNMPYHAYNDSGTIDIEETRSRTLHQLEKQRRHSTIEYGGSRQQLYKDADSDHQPVMLHSNVYIDNESYQRLQTGATSEETRPRKIGSLQSMLGQIHERSGDLDNCYSGADALPSIHKNVSMQIKNTFHKKQSSVAVNVHHVSRTKKQSTAHKLSAKLVKKMSNLNISSQKRVEAHLLSNRSASMNAQYDSKGLATSVVTDRFGDSANHYSQTFSPRLKPPDKRSKSVLPSSTQREMAGGSVMVNSQSKEQLLMTTPLFENDYGEITLKANHMTKPRFLTRKPSRLEKLLAVPKVDPNKVVLEMDIIDKSKLAEQQNEAPKEFVKGKKKEVSLDISD